MQAKQETQVWSLSWEDPLEQEMATHSSILAWEIPWTERSLVGYNSQGHKESDMTEHAHMCTRTHTHTHTHTHTPSWYSLSLWRALPTQFPCLINVPSLSLPFYRGTSVSHSCSDLISNRGPSWAKIECWREQLTLSRTDGLCIYSTNIYLHSMCAAECLESIKKWAGEKTILNWLNWGRPG